MTNTKFIKNNAADNGGAVYLKYGTLNSHNVQYIQNIAGEGGGLYLNRVKPSTINNDLITLNKAVQYGGGIMIYGDTSTNSTLSLTRTIFKHNNQTTGTAPYNGGGGLFIL